MIVEIVVHFKNLFINLEPNKWAKPRPILVPFLSINEVGCWSYWLCEDKNVVLTWSWPLG